MYSPDLHVFTISHLCHATQERVWQVWTDEKHLQHWFGPQGASLTPLRMTLKPDGLFHYRLNTPDGNVIWGVWKYVELTPPERLAAIVSFSDMEGNITRHPQNEGWPREIFSVIEFREQGDKTLVTVEWSPHHASDEENMTFDNAHVEMTIGWRASFDKLDSYLEAIK